MWDLVFIVPAALLAGAGVHRASLAVFENRDRDRLRGSLSKDHHSPHGRAGIGLMFLSFLPRSLVVRLRSTLSERDIADFEVERREDIFLDEQLGRRLIGMAVGLIGGLLVVGVRPAGAVAGGLFAYFLWRLPLARHRRLAEERRRYFARLLPEALDMLALAIDAGVSFDRGLALYCGRFENPIACSFRRALDERALGKSRKLVFEEMAASVNVDSFTAAVGAILRAEKLGAPLADALKKQAMAARVAHEEAVKELSATAPVKMLFPIAGLILPALLIIIIGPALLQFI